MKMNRLMGVHISGGSAKTFGLGDGSSRGEGVPPLRVAGILPAIRGQDALDTEEQGQDGLATQDHRQDLRS